MKRIYYPYYEWEDYSNGMYGKCGKDEYQIKLDKAILFTGDHIVYGKGMLEVLIKWPKSSAHNLTNLSMNRRAWIGHAACCLMLGIPDHVTIDAWHNLTELQQDLANTQANNAISIFENRGLYNCFQKELFN